MRAFRIGHFQPRPALGGDWSEEAIQDGFLFTLGPFDVPLS